MVFPAIVGKMLIGIEVIAKRNNSSSTKTRYEIVFIIALDQLREYCLSIYLMPAAHRIW